MTIEDFENRHDRIRAACKELEEYAAYCDNELGELCVNLCELYRNYYDYFSDDNFLVALEREITNQLENFRQHAKIIVKEVKIPETVAKMKELVWDDE